MQARVQKWGNSLAVRIPKSFALESHLSQDSLIEISVEAGKIILQPVKPAPASLAQLLEAVNAMSLHPKKQPTPKPTITTSANSADAIAAPNERKAEAERQKKLRSQKEIVIECATLIGKGYPAPVNLDSGTGTKMD